MTSDLKQTLSLSSFLPRKGRDGPRIPAEAKAGHCLPGLLKGAQPPSLGRFLLHVKSQMNKALCSLRNHIAETHVT